MEAAGEHMRNRGRWLDALGNLRKARASLQQFMGERMTADIEQTHWATRSEQLEKGEQ